MANEIQLEAPSSQTTSISVRLRKERFVHVVDEITTGTMPSSEDLSDMSWIPSEVTFAVTEPEPVLLTTSTTKKEKQSSGLAKWLPFGGWKKKNEGRNADGVDASRTTNNTSSQPFPARRRIREIKSTTAAFSHLSSIKNHKSAKTKILSCQPTPTERQATISMSTSQRYESIGPTTSSPGSACRRMREASISFNTPPQAPAACQPLAACNRIREISIRVPQQKMRPRPSRGEAKAYIRSCRPTAAQRHCTSRSKLRNTEKAPSPAPTKPSKKETPSKKNTKKAVATSIATKKNKDETEEDRDHRRRIRRVGSAGGAAVAGSLVGGACFGPVGAAIFGAGAAAASHSLVVRGERKKDERVMLQETFDYNSQQPQIEIM